MNLTDGNIDRLFRQPTEVQTFIAVHFSELKSKHSLQFTLVN